MSLFPGQRLGPYETLSPDARMLACCRNNSASSLWLLTLETPAAP